MGNLEQLYLSNLQSIINPDISGRFQCANGHIKFYIFTFTRKVKRDCWMTCTKCYMIYVQYEIKISQAYKQR